MKLSEMFIGQIVMLADSESPLAVGYVVDLALLYDACIEADKERQLVLPVVKFVEESIPRKINPSYLLPYKEK